MVVEERFKLTEVGMIPEDWEVYSVSDLVKLEGGSQPPLSTFSKMLLKDYIRLIQIRDYKSDKNIVYIPKNLARKLCTVSDIMIGRYGPPIFQILKGIEGAYNVALVKAVPLKKLGTDYLYHFLKQDSLFNFIEKLSQRSGGQTGIDIVALRKYPFPLPPTQAEQNTIATALNDADALIAQIGKSIKKKESS